jgi:hypothetical protein
VNEEEEEKLGFPDCAESSLVIWGQPLSTFMDHLMRQYSLVRGRGGEGRATVEMGVSRPGSPLGLPFFLAL